MKPKTKYLFKSQTFRFNGAGKEDAEGIPLSYCRAAKGVCGTGMGRGVECPIYRPIIGLAIAKSRKICNACIGA